MPTEDSIQSAIQRQPLLAFSLYTACHVQALERKAEELEKISSNWSNGPITDFDIYYDDFWFWTLGAYEVIRTMSQHKNCFSEEVSCQIDCVKKQLAQLRMPFAKQELRGERGAIYGENSVIGFDARMVFRVEGEDINSSALVRTVMNFLKSIKLSDITAHIPKAPPN